MPYLVLILLCLSFAYAGESEDIQDLKKRVQELESRQYESYLKFDDQKNVSSFFSDQLTLGGFFDGGLETIWGTDTRTQINPSDQILGINLSAQLSDKFYFIGQFVHVFQHPLENPNNNPDAATIGLSEGRRYLQGNFISIITQAAVEYRFNRFFNLQGGQGFVPFGYILEVREPVLYIRSKGPQLANNVTDFTPFWTGLHLYGSAPLKFGEWGYDLYTFDPNQPSRKMGLGARTWLANNAETVIGGLSFQIADTDPETYKTIGTDIRIRKGAFQTQGEFVEYISQIRQNTWTAYAEPGYWLKDEEFLLFVFTDYIFNASYRISKPTNSIFPNPTQLADPYQQWQNGIGINWLPNARIRLRLQATWHDYLGSNSTIQGKTRDYYSAKASAGVSF